MPLKIYYLDDEIDLLVMFEDTFSGPDRQITTFSDPEKAIAAIEAAAPDILFIDFRLPNCTGDHVAQMLDPKIPKVLITGDMQVKSTYMFDAVFEKPFKTAQIETLLQSYSKLSKAA